MDYSLPGSSVHGIFQARVTGAGCHFLLQGIFLTQGSNPHLLGLLRWQADFLPLCHLEAHPTRLGHHRAPNGAPWATRQLPTSALRVFMFFLCS